ncbi:hypothetical protein PMIN06_011526 [Paraphaeosphaeria minitans]|uniref:Uncharacterized protein n=1 Tax=Paraphaeosphaeria minitans TaxID=565426 RepID=A0A9P6GK76_9PLEO|nr:hypothetical protein PMIN01_04960 [Paraphaeosphaeria minitans]
MASPYEAQKRRPPPIEIPPAYPPRPIVPGPNAFAIAERAKEEQLRRAEGSQQVSMSHPSTSGPAVSSQWGASAADEPSSPGYPRSNLTATKLSSKEAYSNLVDQVRKSPRKSGNSQHSASVTSRHDLTTRSRHSERSYHSLVREEATSRAEIEAQKERKLFKLIGQVPETPTDGSTPLPDNYVSINDLRQGRGSQLSKYLDQEVVTRSPKKKFFGMNIPFSSRPLSRDSKTPPAPPMPLKAARLMGATPPGNTRKFSPLPKMPGRVAVPRSDTSKSLPSKVFNQPGTHGYSRRRSPVQLSPRGRTSRKSSPPKSPTKAPLFAHVQTLETLTGPSHTTQEFPPVPPRKDSLPPALRQRFPDLDKKIDALKAAKADRTVSQLLRPPTPETGPDDFKDSGMKLMVPSVLPVDPIPSRGGESPSKYCPPGDKAKFVEGEPLFSAHGVLEYTIDEEDEPTYSAPLTSPDKGKGPLSTLRAENRSAPATPISATSAWLQRGAPHVEAAEPKKPSTKLEYLLPTVYSPPKTAVRKKGKEIEQDTFQPADFTRSNSSTASSQSIPIVFKGDVREIDPQSATARSISHGASEYQVLASRADNVSARIMEELRMQPPTAGPSKGPTHGNLQPEQSSSQLTDMLSGVSPSRVDFRSYDSSSAVPSPLHRTPPGAMGSQQMPNSGQVPPAFPHIPMPPPLKAGVPIHDHFYMTNEHIDVVAMSVYDWVQSCNNHAIKIASSKHEQLKATVDQRFDDIRSQINSVGEKADHNGNQGHNLSIQLDKLREFIKAEVVEPLAAQTARLNAMDHGIKELQKSVQDLQTQSQSQSQATTTVYPSPNEPSALVNSRSQPSLPPFYDASGTGNGPHPSVSSGPTGFGRFGSNTLLGRPPYGRDGRENSSSYAFPNMGNPYHSPGASFNHGAGGYPQPPNNYPPMHEQQGYGYNQVLPK